MVDSIPKTEIDLTNVEKQVSVENSKALNVIFNGVDLHVFKLINSCSLVKEVLKFVEVPYNGTSKVKISCLWLVAMKFEALKMTEEEIIVEYNVWVLKIIANESFNLTEKILES